ncbi:DUF4393 domain-containing protein [Halomonas cupida]|uniref:Abi-alpha family protein n=1 Tax=Halomonas cupida TaxID=44933 RepID=UPI0039B63A26
MNDDSNQRKINITSTALEKGIDVAKEFIDKLVLPPAEELGFLIKDQISLWRFNNQVKILNKAKAVCEKNNVDVKAIPPKLLCPYLEHASLEDNDELQDKWAILLVNMVDSQQNIHNHVFPYILSQLSIDEFKLLESVLIEKERRVSELDSELSEFLENRSNIETRLKSEIYGINQKLQSQSPDGKQVYSAEAMELRSSVRSKERELRSLENKEFRLRRKISAPENIPEKNIKEFEIANIIRLGLAKVVYEASAGTHSIEIPISDRDSSYASVDFDIEIDTDTSTILTELGELFIDACREKNS